MRAKVEIYYLAGYELSGALSAKTLCQCELVPLPSNFDRIKEWNEVSGIFIVDTYMLGLGFLDRLLKHVHAKGKGSLVLVIDAYTEEIFINRILEKGVAGYLHVDDLSEMLDQSIRELVDRHSLGDDGLVPAANVVRVNT